ncbi:hypothetical protein [Aneurinibacillus aneurinilyticus]|uniref:hypothetical protein n=1 Tax=Aneurinibacillus aneurinilyticus TaxID=1391 RepID=UPI0011DE3413|nr:hypothetical protein [Aneurinibacillus aneurinilyticus]MED0707564.1 hypothetical protein [Aneurinibacillus aneurinilyticus]MED0723931.1 hypothetical protein [Aneurinibacillus aneurinilyticus]MED0735024.1 hypothetical protein [Aneurinibacillus aneurinilyticus]MED0739397.1 hypothetical protein [Aneurinibacillus aneurinilyticus]
MANKWRNAVEKDLLPFVEKEGGKLDSPSVLYDDRVGYEYNINVNNTPTYHTITAKPTILITLPREKEVKDKEGYDKTIVFMKEQPTCQCGV